MTCCYTGCCIFASILLASILTTHGQDIDESGGLSSENENFKVHINQKERLFKSSTPSQNRDFIDTLQWAVYLNTEYDMDKDSVNYTVWSIADSFDLRYEGPLGGLNNWYLLSHKLHAQTRGSLSKIHDSIVYENYNAPYQPYMPSNSSVKHSNLSLRSVLKNYNTHINAPVQNLINKKKIQPPLVHKILPLFEKQLQKEHKISQAEWKNIIDLVNWKLKSHPDVQHVMHQKAKFRTKRTLQFQDPEFPYQWHLVNHVEWTMDINVTHVWEAGYTGKGVTVCVVDDGIQWKNPDLYPNYNSKGSWDLQTDDADPTPDFSKETNHHGTRCAGEIAAAANGVCGVGVAYEAQIAGIRIIDGPMTDAMEATAFTKNMDINDVYSCSWGPEDDGETVDGPDFLAEEGLRHGVEYGRHGYGSLFVIASGNGGLNDDNCNFDGYANSIYTITIGAVNERGAMPYYAEQCASMLAVTFSNGDGLRNIVTTDWTAQDGKGCTRGHTGTSAAAPLASGMLALAIQANPCLTWRDFKYLIILTAVKVDEQLAHYTRNAAGLYHSHQHGFGLMDAWRLVNAARVWTQVPWMTTFSTNQMKVKKEIPGNRIPLTVSYEVTAKELDGYSLGLLEELQVTVSITHVLRGDLQVTLVCPSHTESVLGATRSNDKSNAGFTDWTFTTVRCWGEDPLGTFKLIILDTGRFPYSRGHLIKWRLKLHGVPMTKNELKKRQKLVHKSYSGQFLGKAHDVTCEAAPEQLTFTAPISERVLKMICMSAVFCFLMALYEMFEDIFCYNDEKKEQAEQDRVARAQHSSATSATATNGYSALVQNDPTTDPECIQMQDVSQLHCQDIESARYQDIAGGRYQDVEGASYQQTGGSGYRDIEGAGCQYLADESLGVDQSGYQALGVDQSGYQALGVDHSGRLYEDFEINTNDLISNRNVTETDNAACDNSYQQSDTVKLLAESK